MKRSILSLLVIALAIASVAVGCKKKPYGLTPLGQRGGLPLVERPHGPITDTTGPTAAPTPHPTTVDLPLPANPNGTRNTTGLEKFDGMPADREPLKAQTAYFDLDSSVVKKSEHSKLKAVADYLAANAPNKLLIEGHCDERGTDLYNLSLGERRALALREYLANSGVSPDRVRTISYGRERPAEQGHDEAAWSKNRRGEFVVLLPKP